MRPRLLGAVAAALLLAGCSSTAESAPPAQIEAAYFDTVRSEIGGLADEDDATLRKMGRWVVCGSLTVGDDASWFQTLAILEKGGLQADQAGVLIGAATTVYCPEKSTVGPV